MTLFSCPGWLQAPLLSIRCAHDWIWWLERGGAPCHTGARFRFGFVWKCHTAPERHLYNIHIYLLVCFCLFIYWCCLSTGKMVTNRNLGKPIFGQAKCTWWLLEADWHWSRKRWGHRFDWHQWDFNWSWKLRMQDIPPACWKLAYDVAKSTTGGFEAC